MNITRALFFKVTLPSLNIVEWLIQKRILTDKRPPEN